MTSLVAESDRRLEPGRPARGKDRRDRAHQGGHEPYEAELHVGEVKIQHVAQQVGEGPADPQGAQGDADHTAQHETERAHHQRLDQHHALQIPAPDPHRTGGAQLARALDDPGSERVRDPQRPDEEDHAAEHVDTRETPPNLRYPVVDHLPGGEDAQRVLGPEIAREGRPQRDQVRAGLGAHPDAVHLAVVPMTAVEGPADLHGATGRGEVHGDTEHRERQRTRRALEHERVVHPGSEMEREARGDDHALAPRDRAPHLIRVAPLQQQPAAELRAREVGRVERVDRDRLAVMRPLAQAIARDGSHPGNGSEIVEQALRCSGTVTWRPAGSIFWTLRVTASRSAPRFTTTSTRVTKPGRVKTSSAAWTPITTRLPPNARATPSASSSPRMTNRRRTIAVPRESSSPTPRPRRPASEDRALRTHSVTALTWRRRPHNYRARWRDLRILLPRPRVSSRSCSDRQSAGRSWGSPAASRRSRTCCPATTSRRWSRRWRSSRTPTPGRRSRTTGLGVRSSFRCRHSTRMNEGPGREASGRVRSSAPSPTETPAQTRPERPGPGKGRSESSRATAPRLLSPPRRRIPHRVCLRETGNHRVHIRRAAQRRVRVAAGTPAGSLAIETKRGRGMTRGRRS